MTARARADECTGASAQAALQDYQRGLADYRAGHAQASYPALQSAYASCPDNVHYRNDYIATAVGAGHAADALAAGGALDPGGLPVYVLEALARAARDTRQPDLAIHYYDLLLVRGENIGASVGRDLALIDRGSARAAQSDLTAWHDRYPGRADVLEALGLADESLGEFVPALAAAESLLALDPQHVNGLRLRFRMLMAIGAPQLALAETPDAVLSPAQLSRARHDALALEYRWARDQPGTERARARQVDEVIVRMRAALADASITTPVQVALRCDLVEALSERGRSGEALAEYDALSAEGATLPPYATSAAISAALAQRRPERALELFHALPPASQQSFGDGVNHFYALLETGRYPAAVRWADQMVASQPLYLDADVPRLRRDNADYVGSRVLGAMARAYTDRPAEAQRMLVALHRAAPANRDVGLALAETEAMRGWPRQSADTARGVLAVYPDAVGPQSKIFAAQLQMADWRGAHGTLAQLAEALPPESATWQRAARDWRTHGLAEFGVEGQIGRSHGGRAGVIDSSFAEYAYSAPIHWDYRAYVHLNQSEATPVQGTTIRHAIGAGLEYRSRLWRVTAELLKIGTDGPAPQLAVEATPGDRWRIGASFAQRSLDAPVAAFVVGVSANRASINLDYRSNEARASGVQLGHAGFSDGNSRVEATAYWRERWVTGPVYKLDARVDVDTSSNTRVDTNYFSPARDFSVTATAQSQWLQFRHYESALVHVLDLGVGSYAQQGHGAGLIELLRYQLVYDINERCALKAGFGRTLRPYDGQRERLDTLTFAFLGRF